MIDLILLLIVAEALLLGCYHRVTGRGPALVDVLPNLLSGALLLLAVRLALTQAHWGWLALVLLLSLLTHLLDLRRRWPADASGRSG
jgi:hypothetical protein